MVEPHDTMIMSELFVCGGCARQKSATHTNVLGFLSLSQHTKYKKDARRCSSLHCTGYIIIPRKEWEDNAPSFPRHLLKEILCANKIEKKSAKLPSKDGFRTEKRKWLPFKKLPVSLQEYHAAITPRIERILHADIAYGRIAITNSMMGENLKNTDIFVNQSTVTISEAAALWRGEGLDDYQSPHADGESGPFSMPVKSLCHKQEIWGEKKSIQWFGGREGVDMNVTDLSIHFTIDSTGSAMHCNASHTTGSTEILRVNVIDKENDDLEEYSKWKFTNQCNIENALKRYEERTRGPEICDLAGPCLNFRQETDYILECFKVGKTPNLRASRHRGCNNRD